ncbi:MAG: polyprenyl synthetase family protein [Candidatus Bipolaricaulota bacterium]
MTDVPGGLPETITRYRRAIARQMENYVCRRDGPLHEMIRYHMGFEEGANSPGLQGKVLRPSLLLFTAEGFGVNWRRALPAAVSLELVHNFSLVHDDIQDDDYLRRGRKSVQAKWGAKQAINAGDGIRDLSTLALVELADSTDPGLTLNATEILGTYSLEMISGQVRDLQFTDRAEITMEDYLGMIDKKTCALLKASLHLGGLYAGVDQETVKRLKAIGRYLGYVFQIRDDWLGIWGEQEQFGKSVGSDLQERKRSFPVVYALGRPSGEELEKFEEIYFSDGDLSGGEIDRVRKLLEELGAREGTNDWAGRYWKQAKEELAKIDMKDWAKTDLRNFGKYLLTRQR